MHAKHNSRPTLLALIVNPIDDVDPTDPLTPALAGAIASRLPGSYVEEDENGDPRVVYPGKWLRHCGRKLNSIDESLANAMAAVERDLRPRVA